MQRRATNAPILNSRGATAIPFLDARFDPFSVVPGALGGAECTYPYNFPALDMGRWTLTAGANPNSGVYDCTLFPTNYTNPASDFWTVMRSNGTWALVNGTCDPSSTVNIVRRLGMDGFSEFGVAQSDMILPVDLVRFDGEHRIDHNFLEWETAQEVENDYFVIERSLDNETFTEIGEVDAVGNSSSGEYYTFRDRDLQESLHYYRLRQFDQNGASQTSHTVAIRTDGTSSGLSGLYPNPAESVVYLDVTTLKEETLQLELMDMSGKILKGWNEGLTRGFTTLSTPVGELAEGIYLLKVSGSTPELNRVYKLVVQ